MKLGFVGLGVQGKHLALNLRAAGHDLMVFDVRKEALSDLVAVGAKSASTASEVGAFADITAVCVRDDEQAIEAVSGREGLLKGTNPGCTIVLHSTVAPKTVLALADAAGQVGVDLIDAPVSGGERGARMRAMSFMVGGPDAVVARCGPLFAASGNTVTHTGPVGSAMQAKVVHQLIVCVNMLAAHEGIRLGLAAGLSPEILSKVISEGAAQSRMADNWFKLSLRPHAIGVFDKDLALCLQLAADLSVPAPGAALAKSRIEEIVP